MNTRLGVGIGVVVTLAIAVAAVYLWPRTDPKLEKVKELQNKMFSEEGEKLPEEERRQLGQELAKESRDLKKDQREEVFKGFQQAFEKRVDRFLALSREEQQKFLDEDINRMEAMRKFWDKRRSGREGKEGGGRRGPGGPGGGGAPGGEGGRGPGGPPRGDFNDPKQRQQFFSQMLDRTSPTSRAKMGEYFMRINDRRQERGMPKMGPGF